MTEWKKYTLDEVCSHIFSGGTPSTTKKEYWNGDINWLSSGETGNKYISRTERKITQLGVDNSTTKLAQKGCTVVASAGQGFTRGQTSFLLIDTYVNQSVIVFEANENIIDKKFLYYNLANRYEEFRLLSDGTSTRGGLSGWIVKRMEISLPPLPTQKKIAEVLSCLDAKIELNRRINENLEQQAQAIFKEWFVDNAKPEWKVGKLCEIADIIMGQSPDGKSYNEEGNGKIFFQGRAEFGDRFPTIRLYTTEPKRIAPQNSVLLSVRAPVGDINVALEECCIGRGLASITAKGDYQSFVLYTMKNAKTALDVYNGEGTIFGCVNKDALNNLDVIIPPMEEIMKFEEVAKPIDEKIKANTIESRLLVKIRDALLPKLMNGEIEV